MPVEGRFLFSKINYLHNSKYHKSTVANTFVIGKKKLSIKLIDN